MVLASAQRIISDVQGYVDVFQEANLLDACRFITDNWARLHHAYIPRQLFLSKQRDLRINSDSIRTGASVALSRRVLDDRGSYSGAVTQSHTNNFDSFLTAGASLLKLLRFPFSRPYARRILLAHPTTDSISNLLWSLSSAPTHAFWLRSELLKLFIQMLRDSAQTHNSPSQL